MPLLTTKLHIPPLRPEQVPRLHLMRRLDEGTARRLTLVSAPAGFGKTSLLSEWLHRDALCAAWLSLDDGDNDPARFLAYLVTAIQNCRPGFGEAILAALGSPQPPSQEALLTALVNEWSAHGEPGPSNLRTVLVLDVYHAVSSPAVHQAVTFLLDYLPPPPVGCHLVIASRSDPPLPLARLRGRGQLTELRAADLRFSAEEASSFLHDGMGLALAASEVSALQARTEGWITGLQLAALSLQGRDPEQAAHFVQSFTGSDRYVLDYLVEEVLSREPQPVQRFLLRTSILERLCAPLCDAVVGDLGAWGPGGAGPADSPGQRLLEYLDAHNLFIVPLDHERRWVRYHRLFADLLRSRLARDEKTALYRRACDWCEQHGALAEAIGYALAGGDGERAADLVQANALAMLMRGELSTLLRWLAALPQASFSSRPWLCIYHAWALVLTGQVAAMEPRLQAAEWPHLPEAPPLPAELLGHAAAIRAYRAATAGDIPCATEQAQRALDLLPADEKTVRSVVALTLGGICLLLGNLPGASQAFAEAARLGREGGNIHVAAPALCNLAELDAQRGSLHRAADAFREAIRLAASGTGSPLPVAGQGYGGLSKILYEWNDLEGAELHLTRSIELGRLWGIVDALASDWAFFAVVLLARDEPQRALGCLAEADRLLHGRAMSPLTAAEVAAYRARLHLALGDVAVAARWAQGSQLAPDDVPNFRREFEHLTFARVLIAQGDWDAATRLLLRLRQAAEDSGRMGRVIEVLALLAVALHGQGRVADAIAALDRALSLAAPEGYIRTFVDAGERMADLLRRAMAHGKAPSYLQLLLSAFPTAAKGEGKGTKEQDLFVASPPSSWVEPLTEREGEVLRLVAAGLSNREIADRLVITLATVKSHTNSIYGKLGVRSRTQAIARAGELGLT